MLTLYTKDNCHYCDAAKRLLESKAIPFETKKIGVDIDREVLLEQFSQAKQAPVVTINGVYIGGYDQLLEYVSDETQLLNE